MAHGLRRRGVSVTVFEASARAGGVIRSSRQGEHLLEWGPQRLRLTPEVRELVEDLGLTDRLIVAPADAPIYIVRDGRLHAVPRSIRDLLTASLISSRGRLRLLGEPLTGAVSPTESVADALRRKCGDEAYRVFLGPLIGGLYASDPANMRCGDSLSKFLTRSGSPRSLLLAALSLGGARSPAACSFREGVSSLTDALAHSLASQLRLGQPVERISDQGGTWALLGDGDSLVADGNGYASVVIATPADRAGRILEAASPDASARLRQLKYNRLAVVHLHASGPAIPGFGCQVAFGEPLETRGITFNDALFGRSGIVTAFLGGARNPRLPDWKDERIGALAESEFRRVTGRAAVALEVSRPVVPAYDMTWRALDELRLPAGVHLCAGYLERPGIGGRLRQAARIVERLT